MQQLEIAAIVTLVLGAVVVVLLASGRRGAGGETPLTRLIVGCVLGLVGAVVILAPLLDVVPDGWQTPIEPFLIGGVTLLLLLGSVYRMAR
jgi:uncharacterized membrane protein YeaQ/YmgE (transglycosylase-associated protein family)